MDNKLSINITSKQPNRKYTNVIFTIKKIPILKVHYIQYDRQTGRGYQVYNRFPKIKDNKDLHIRITANGPFLYFNMNLKTK